MAADEQQPSTPPGPPPSDEPVGLDDEDAAMPSAHDFELPGDSPVPADAGEEDDVSIEGGDFDDEEMIT